LSYLIFNRFVPIKIEITGLTGILGINNFTTACNFCYHLTYQGGNCSLFDLILKNTFTVFCKLG